MGKYQFSVKEAGGDGGSKGREKEEENTKETVRFFQNH